jgi:hypothetical protein
VPNRDDVIRQLVSKSRVDVKIKALEVLSEDVRGTILQLTNDLMGIRKMRRCLLHPSLIIHEMDRLWYLNDQLFDAIVGQHDEIEKGVELQRRSTAVISTVVEEHRRYNRHWVILRQELDALRISHATLMRIQSWNNAIESGLFHDVEAMALQGPEIAAYCQSMVRVPAVATPTPTPTPTARLPKLEIASRQPPALSLLERMRHKKSPRITRRGTQHRRLRSGPASISSSVTFSDVMSVIKFRPTECLLLAARGIAISGEETKFHGTLSRLYAFLLNDSLATAQVKLAAYKAEMQRYLRLVAGVSHKMLLVPFANAQVQTDPPPLVDAETLVLTPKEMKEMENRTKRSKSSMSLI